MSTPIKKSVKVAEEFYSQIIKLLLAHHLRFMVGGTHAFIEYTGINRPTGDIDIMVTQEDYPKVLKTLADAGFKVELAEIELRWLAKVHGEKGVYADLIFAERNGLHIIDTSWLERARKGKVIGHNVLLEPVEEMIRSKCYVRNRHRHDEGDVVHLILKQGKNVNWEELLIKMEAHWELLMGNILTFLFVYPSERNVIPKWVIEQLVIKLENRLSHAPTKDRISRGLLLSNDYQVGVSQWGFRPITDLK